MSNTFGCVLVGPTRCDRNEGLVPVARRSFAGRPVVEWVVSRLAEAESVQQTIVVLPDTDDCHEIAETIPKHTRVHMSREADELNRVLEALDGMRVDSLVVANADSPFVDPMLVDRLVSSVIRTKGIDYATFCSRANGHILHAKLGLIAHWVSVPALRRADALLKQPHERDQFCEAITARPEEFVLKLLEAPVELDRDDVRLALETQDDWAHAEAVVDALGFDVDWKEITELLDRQPGLRREMARLNAESSAR